MMKISVLLVLILAGCATQPIPMPAPIEKCNGIKVGNTCKSFTASDISGATSVGAVPEPNYENKP